MGGVVNKLEPTYQTFRGRLQLFNELRTGPAGVEFFDPQVPPATETFLKILQSIGTSELQELQCCCIATFCRCHYNMAVPMLSYKIIVGT